MSHKWQSRIEEIKGTGSYRYIRKIQERTGSELVIDGIRLLNFGSNNYLGLSDHPVICRNATETISVWGTGSGASRLLSGNSSIFEKLESKIAQLKGQESAVLFNCGYMANIGAITSIAGKDDVIFSDALNHASIIDGARLSRARISVYGHCDMEDLEKRIRYENRTGGLIISDGVFSMDGDISPLPELVEIAERYHCTLMIDDAHGTGVLGKTGKGLCEYFNLDQGIDLHMGTLSKAFGSEGGFITGSKILTDLLQNVARPFIFSTAMAPSSAAAASAAIDLVQQEVWRISKLSENARYLRNGLQNLGLVVPDGITPIIPIIVGTNRDTLTFSRILQDQGIFSPAIRPPTVPEGYGRIRMTVMAIHTREELDQAIAACETAGKKTGLLL